MVSRFNRITHLIGGADEVDVRSCCASLSFVQAKGVASASGPGQEPCDILQVGNGPSTWSRGTVIAGVAVRARREPAAATASIVGAEGVQPLLAPEPESPIRASTIASARRPLTP